MTTFNPLCSSAIPNETALEQVADDEDFLKEVLADLITESNTAEEDLADAIKNKNLDGVMKAAFILVGCVGVFSVKLVLTGCCLDRASTWVVGDDAPGVLIC